MRYVTMLFLYLSMIFFAQASPVRPEVGVDYLVLKNPVLTVPPTGRVEVIEFFMYRCPHCYELEPLLQAWALEYKEKISFRRIHVAVRKMDTETRLFLSLSAIEKEKELTRKIFDAIHTDKLKMSEEKVALDWISKQEIDQNKFMSAWDSDRMDATIFETAQLASRYEIGGVPTIVIGGRYLVSPAIVVKGNPDISHADVNHAVIKVMRYLVELSRK